MKKNSKRKGSPRKSGSSFELGGCSTVAFDNLMRNLKAWKQYFLATRATEAKG